MSIYCTNVCLSHSWFKVLNESSNHFVFSRRRWSWSQRPTSRTTGWSSTRDCWMLSPCHCACRYSIEQSRAGRTHRSIWKKPTVLMYNCKHIAGSGCGERVSQSIVQTVGSALPADPGSPSSDDRGPLPHELLWPQEGLCALLTYYLYVLHTHYYQVSLWRPLTP